MTLRHLARMLLALAVAATAPAPGVAANGDQMTVMQVPGPAAPQMPARDVAGPGMQTGTGIIRGRVADAETGRPIRRAIVQVGGRTAGRDVRVTSTNDDGRFEVRELPAGEFSLTVRKPGYVGKGFGARSDAEPPRPIRLADKEVFDKADVVLERGGVVAGRVVDDYGEPALEAVVRVMRRRYFQGKQQLMPVGNPSQSNDIGEYRIFGLPPGDYYVTASQRGDFSRGESDDVMGYAPTYFPAATDIAAAQVVRVTAGAQAQADIVLQPVKLGRILGLLLDATGRPSASGRVMARRVEEGAGVFGFDIPVAASVKPDGSFTINAVTPGRYALQGMPGSNFMMGPGVVDVADGVVDVVGGEISTVTLTIGKGGTIRGHVVVDGSPLESLASLSVTGTPVTPGGMFMGVRPSPVAADGSFELVGVRGPVYIRMLGGAQGVMLKAVRSGGTDVTLDGLDPAGRVVAGVEVHVSKDVADLSGVVTGARGEPLKEYTVVAFHEDQKRWFGAAGRGFATARPDQDGRYSITGFFGGTYLVVALPEFDATTFGDPTVMENLRAMATEVRLADGEKKVLDLRLAAQ